MMSKYFILTILLLTRTLDLLSTYLIADGELYGETNPLVRHFNLGWYGLIIPNIILILIIYLIIKYNNSNLLLKKENHYKDNIGSFTTYLSYIFFDKQVSLVEALIKKIPNLKIYTHTFLSALPLAIVLISLLVIMNNILEWNGTSILKAIEPDYIIHILVFSLFIVLTSIQLSYLFKRYKKI